MKKIIAQKTWQREDIADCLSKKGIACTTKNIDMVCSSSYLKQLEECTDAEWEVINTAILECNFAAPKGVEDLVCDDEVLATYVVNGSYAEYHCIVPINYTTQKPSTDIGACLEMTMHRMIDNGLEEKLYEEMCAEKYQDVCNDDDFDEDAFVSLDLGYGICGPILNFIVPEPDKRKVATRAVANKICDLFEELLEKYDITIPSEDRTGDETEARLYGDEYGYLEDAISSIIADEVKKIDSSVQIEDCYF